MPSSSTPSQRLSDMSRIQRFAYNTSNAGQIDLARTLIGVRGKCSIRVNVLVLGWFPTRIAMSTREQDGEGFTQGVPLSRLGDGSAIDGSVLFHASSASPDVTGHLAVVDGGSSAVL